MTSHLRAVLALSILAALLVACAGQTQSIPQEPLRVEWTLWEGDYTLLIAQEMGYFDMYGVEVEPIFYEVFSESIQDLASAKIDGGLLAIGDVFTVARLTDVSAVMVYDSGGISAVVATPEIQTVADLRGKRIGVNLGTSEEMVIRTMLQNAGLRAQDVTLIEMSPEDVPANLSKQIDAGFIWEPYTSEALSLGNRLLYSTTFDSLLPDLVVFRREVVRRRPDDIRAFVAAWFEAREYRQTNPAESLDIITRVTGLSPDELGITGDDRHYTLEDNLRLYSDSPGENTLSILQIAQINVDFLVSIGELTEMPDLDSIFDPAYLR